MASKIIDTIFKLLIGLPAFFLVLFLADIFKLVKMLIASAMLNHFIIGIILLMIITYFLGFAIIKIIDKLTGFEIEKMD
jgi:hypothetical protein